MPLDARGCTRVTLICSISIPILPSLMGLRQPEKAYRDGDCVLKLLHINEEFLVRVSHQLALITSLSFVHTARRFYRSNCSMRIRDQGVFAVERRCALQGNLSESRNLEEEEVVTRYP